MIIISGIYLLNWWICMGDKSYIYITNGWCINVVEKWEDHGTIICDTDIYITVMKGIHGICLYNGICKLFVKLFIPALRLVMPYWAGRWKNLSCKEPGSNVSRLLVCHLYTTPTKTLKSVTKILGETGNFGAQKVNLLWMYTEEMSRSNPSKQPIKSIKIHLQQGNPWPKQVPQNQGILGPFSEPRCPSGSNRSTGKQARH